jgi:uncharacterized membrane protein
MSIENPYAAGDAPPALPIEATSEVVLAPQPTSNGAGRSFGWIKTGFGDFGRGPWAHIGFLILIVVAMFMISIAASFASLMDPALGILVNLGTSLGMNVVTFVLVAGFLLAVRRARATGHVRFEDYFAGFQHPRLGALLGVGALYVAANMALAIVAVLVLVVIVGPGEFVGLVSAAVDPYGGAPSLPAWMRDEDTMLALALTGATLAVILWAALWIVFLFAAHLVTLTDVSVGGAFKVAVGGALRNILPLIVWTLASLVLLVLGTLTCGLGLLVIMPAVWASGYQAFLDIYTTERAP